MSDHLDATAPLRHLVKTMLHKGRSVADNARRLRWKRKRPTAAAPPTPEAAL